MAYSELLVPIEHHGKEPRPARSLDSIVEWVEGENELEKCRKADLERQITTSI